MERFLGAILAIMSLFGCFCNPVYAANETEAYTTVTYTVDQSYNVIIPSSLSLNTSTGIEITASDVMLRDGYRVLVTLDKSQLSYDGDRIKLFGKSELDYIICDIEKANINNKTSTFGIAEDSFLVALFESGNTQPVKYGYIKLRPYADNASTGTYSTSFHYVISVSNIW